MLGNVGDTVVTETSSALLSWGLQSSGGTDPCIDNDDSEWAGLGYRSPGGHLIQAGRSRGASWRRKH